MNAVDRSSTDSAWGRVRSRVARLRAYVFSDSRRSLQTCLGLLWLLDGALQFQSFMYSKDEMLTGMSAGQPSWISSSITWAAHLAQRNVTVYNTAFALAQVEIGLGILCRRTVRPALAASFAWALIVWWFGEGFGMMFTSRPTPLSGAPGAVLLYALIGMTVWPNDRAGGLIGVRGARIMWGSLWCVIGSLWLLPVNSSANANTTIVNAAPSGASWLSSVQDGVASAAKGYGLVIATALALLSFAIGIAVGTNWHPRKFLWAAIALNLAYWIVGQGIGGILAGGATDPNAAPLFILFAAELYSLTPIQLPRTAAAGSPAKPAHGVLVRTTPA